METPERPGFYEEDFYEVPEQRDDPNEEDRRESLQAAKEAYEKLVGDDLNEAIVDIMHPDPRYVHTRRQAD